MNANQHINEATRIARSISGCYSLTVKNERKLLLLTHIKKACQLKK